MDFNVRIVVFRCGGFWFDFWFNGFIEGREFDKCCIRGIESFLGVCWEREVLILNVI